MSAYIVEYKTINRIVNRLVREVRDNPDSYTILRHTLRDKLRVIVRETS